MHWVARIKARCTITESGCWLWPGGLSRNGYAQDAYRSKGCRVHRKMFEIANGVTLERWQYACHTCDTRHCVNPAHVWIGTPKDNQQDMSRKGRAGFQSATHCRAGHEMTPENTRRYPPNYRRSCVACQRIRQRVAAGWPKDLAHNMPSTPPGLRPVGGKFKRNVAV